MSGQRLQIGVLGGTFDPIHLAHLRLAEEAREQLGLQRVLFVPAPRPWRKSGRRITPIAHRLAMVRLALAGNPAFDVSTVELEQAGPTYTTLTLEALRAELGAGVTLHFILGSDALQDLPNWWQPQRLVRLAKLAVAARGELPAHELASLDRRIPGLADACERIEMPALAISSTDLRRRVAAGRSLRYLVPDSVAAYIAEHGLYLRARLGRSGSV
ncbi:MAG TPA: nicotinate-nucleotide adenylyltransferase [Dehalococcoidia bacterium]|nr:nicotinate-nucleotide adenylyltransferase [Dehalococcoidia bacterium]